MQPRVGLDVHYVSLGSKDGRYPQVCRTAKITEVGGWRTVRARHLEGADAEGREHAERVLQQVYDPELCAVTVLNPDGWFVQAIEHAEPDAAGEFRGGTWHYDCAPAEG